jgi:hypothetical protein
VPDTSRFLTALGRVLRGLTQGRGSGAANGSADAAGAGVLTEERASPGRAGASATVEVDPARLRGVRLAHAPSRDGEPDPGEVVWTWVPYEEHDGRGKDRPVVIVAAGAPGEYLAVQLTSKPHDGDRDHVSLGTGPWDPEGRPSWARIDRVFRVHADGMRREAAALDAERFARIAEALRARYGWR